MLFFMQKPFCLYFRRFFSAFSMRSKWNSERVCSNSA